MPLHQRRDSRTTGGRTAPVKMFVGYGVEEAGGKAVVIGG